MPVPPEEADAIAALAPRLTYGWGVIPTTVLIGGTTFTTSLFPRDGGYLAPWQTRGMTTTPCRPGRSLAPGQLCRIRIRDRATGRVRTVHETAERLFEAPNWSPDGRLLLNGEGRLWWLPVTGGEPAPIDAPGLPPVNNDHVLAPDGATIVATGTDGHLWRLPASGGEAVQVTGDDGGRHYLHGIRPDGQRLAYVHLVPGPGKPLSARIRTCAPDGSDVREVPTEPGPADGPAWTADGSALLVNTEAFSTAPGHAQIARMREDGTGRVQLTHDERVNWFAHAAPTGDAVLYLSYPPGTESHPADLEVELRLVEDERWDAPRTLVTLHGGQGTINVPSWAPDGSAFAYVDYPNVAAAGD